MAGFAMLGVVFAALAVAVLLVILARGAGTTALARIVRIGSAAYIALVVISVGTTVAALATDGPVEVDVPIAPRPVEVPDGVEFSPEHSPPATIVGDPTGASLTLSLAGLPVATRLLLGAGHVAMAATLVLLALAVWRLAGAMRDGDPFLRSVVRAVTTAAVAIGVGGSAWSVLLQLGSWNAGRDALEVNGWSGEGLAAEVTSLGELGWPEPAYFGLTFETWPLMIALALGAVAAVLRSGAALRDRAARLERETEGLV
jgi:hypothetical protein